MDDTAASTSEQPPARDQKRHNGIPVLAASVVLVGSALGWQLMGAGVVVHFLVLLSGIAIGTLFRQGSVDRAGAAERATAAAAAGGRASATGAASVDGTPASGNDGGLATPAGGQHESPVPSFLSNTETGGGFSSAAAGGATPSSPLHWVGETMEGSINWLRGNKNINNSIGNGRKTSAAQSRNGRRPTTGNRRRSTSTGGATPTSPTADETVMAVRSAATSPTPAAARRAEADALPPLDAGVPQEQQGQVPPPPARSRLWSRTFGGGGGSGSGTVQQQQQRPTGEGFGTDAYDGDDSVEDDDGTDGEESLQLRGASAGVGDWLVGAGLGDTR